MHRYDDRIKVVFGGLAESQRHPRSGVSPRRSNIDERDPQIRPLLATKARRRLDNRDLEGRPNLAAQKVTSPNAAVAKSEHRVEMQAGLAVISLRYVAQQSQ